ncbi:hypothetical protein ACFQ48_08215 [Hymenobacter caeli]|uniref:Uncharacterized protein n=1 Tax=Hymenobacter caeli TaxID=2735894 RepID=A0ABX2FP89_9BACT|nr:hypothetical protein [Hymenobacter caeli]NRT18229.1 hypothetical protein [Hymenobacter caeli]
MKNLAWLLLAGLPLAAAAQPRPPYVRPACAGLMFVSTDNNCAQAVELARRDVRANTLSLVLVSGEAPVIFTADSILERQFKVQYFEEGCVAPAKSCVVAYNHFVFDQLQATYGDTWRRKVRRDVVGLKEWMRKR